MRTMKHANLLAPGVSESQGTEYRPHNRKPLVIRTPKKWTPNLQKQQSKNHTKYAIFVAIGKLPEPWRLTGSSQWILWRRSGSLSKPALHHGFLTRIPCSTKLLRAVRNPRNCVVILQHIWEGERVLQGACQALLRSSQVLKFIPA